MSLRKRDAVYLQIQKASGGIVRCYCCGQPVSQEEATLEHVVPKSLGGNSRRRNLSISHARCNHVRGSHVTKEEAALVESRGKRKVPIRYEEAAAHGPYWASMFQP